MARGLIVYLDRASAPAREALQAALKELGFKLSLDEGYAPFETKGYLPCVLDGEDAGFDLRFGDVENVSPNHAAALGRRDVAMLLRWGGDPREHFAALAVCIALVEKFNAIVADAEKLLTLEELRARARKLAASF
jgi:hypothetical protein